MKQMEVILNLSWVLLIIAFVQANDPETLIIDCGATSRYVDMDDWNYVPDDEFIETGKISNISSSTIDYYSSYPKSYLNLRSFPLETRNCYRLKSVKGYKYLIRLTYLYGNYDNLNSPPQFDVYFGQDYLATVNLTKYPNGVYYELITVATSDFLFLCLINTDQGIPIISEIRLVTLPNDLYGDLTSSGSLLLSNRLNVGSEETVRYPDDKYDRTWEPWSLYSSTINTAENFDNLNMFKPPSKVLQTASIPSDNGDSFSWVWDDLENSSDLYHIVLYFAELEKLKQNESREFNIYHQESLFNDVPINPQYLTVTPINSKQPLEGKTLSFSLNKTTNSTRPPLLNAMELYLVRRFNESATDRQDVDAIMGIKAAYQVKKNWMGDPCLPKNFSWRDLTCSYTDPPRITSFDLSNNKLSGAIPEFLAQLTSLKEVNLSNNWLSGSIPNSLKDRIRNGLKLSIDNNPDLDKTVMENHKGKKTAVVAIIALVGFILFVALIFLCIFRRKNKKKSLYIHNQNMTQREFQLPAAEQKIFTYSEVLVMTNNFENIIGKGGFGFVYRGYLNGARVAVKVLSDFSKQGSKEFSTEINLLMKIHHKSLVSLVGYCHEDTKMVLIYEYMEGGNLQNMLSSDSTDKTNFLSWKQRLHIAFDAAQGLEYLHHGCKPPIIHRDVKTTNILLNERLEAKVADFGLSKAYPTGGFSHLSTTIMGTPGYIDPEYYALCHLNEKSDVYSFGVVLLELLTGEPPLGKNFERIHIVQRVKGILQKGEIKEVIDQRLNGECDVNSAWKFAEIALECTLQNSVERPSMIKVVSELKECLISETRKYQQGYLGDETERYILFDQHLDIEPAAR